VGYVEDAFKARTKPADFFSIPLVDLGKIYVKARLSSVRRKNRDDGFGVQVKVSIVE
jgi:hypothetical protein